jgi:hypothetical protein
MARRPSTVTNYIPERNPPAEGEALGKVPHRQERAANAYLEI